MTLFSCEEGEKPIVEKYQKIGQTILNQGDEKKVMHPVDPVESEMQSISINEDLPEPIEKVEIVPNKIQIEQKLMLLGKVDAEQKVIPNQDEVFVIPEMPVYLMAGMPSMSPD